MHKNNKLLISFSFILLLFISNLNSYEPDWKSLDQRPIPDWYDKAKIGMYTISYIILINLDMN